MILSPTEITAAVKAIQDHQRILVVPHANVDPDGLSSALACFMMFHQLGKDVTVICPDTLPESLNFLPGFEKLEQTVPASQNFVITVNLDQGLEVDKLRYTVEENKVNIIVVPKKGRITKELISLSEGDPQFDLIVVVDTADTALLGTFYSDNIDLFSSVPILNIDHHISNTRYGQLHLINSTAASATEVLYSWFTQVPEWRNAITPDMATLLLTGLITDTRSFQNPNTTPRSLEVAAELLERGARQQEIVQHIYKTKPLSTLKIWGRALNRIQMDPAGAIVWSAVSREDLVEMDASSKETHGILDELISTIPDADVHVLFTEVEDGGLKASLRSSAAIDSSKLAAEAYGGGGHPRAAGFRVAQYDNFQLQVLECVQKLKDGMQRQRAAGIDGTQMEVRPEKQKPIPTKEVEQTVPEKQQPGPQERVQTEKAEPEPPVRKTGSTDIIQGLTG